MSSSLIDRILSPSVGVGNQSADDQFITPQRSSGAGVDAWMNDAREGELAVDVFQTDDAVVIQAAIAGVRSEDIAIDIQNDIVTIRGMRLAPANVPPDRYLYKECFWGPFSRTIILPFGVRSEDADAVFQNGILTLKLPHAARVNMRSSVAIKDMPYEQ